jgi:hypothetical protein
LASTGTLAILQVEGVPQPNPSCIKLRLSGSCDQIRVRVFTAAFNEVSDQVYPGAAMGWTSLPLSTLSGGMKPGTYFAMVEAERNGGSKARKTLTLVFVP